MTIKISQFLNGGEMRVNDLVAGLRTVATTTNDYKFDFPGTGIKDSVGNYLLRWLPGSGVNTNYVQFTSASSGNPALVAVAGGDDDINLSISGKGRGHAFFAGTGAFGMPVGTTAQEPTGFAGGMRYDTDTDFVRYWDVGLNAWVDIISGAALDSLTFVTNTDERADAPNSQPLSLLATGIMMVTTTTGIVSSLSIPLAEIYGGTHQSTYTLGDTLYSSAANTLSKLAGNTTAVKQYLSQTGTGAVSAAPAWATISGGDITGAALTRVDDANVTLTLGGTPATALLRAASITAGWTGVLSLARGGSNAALVADLGGIVYSTATAMAILASTPTAGKVLQSGASAAPTWSTPTYPSASGTVGKALRSDGTNNVYSTFTIPDTYVLGDTLYASAANTLTALTGNTTVVKQYLSQTGDGANSAAPAWATISGGDITGAALTKVDDTNITLTLGGTPTTALLRATSITAGWTGLLSGTRGGTGVNNGASLITIGGNVTFSGAFTFAGTLTGSTAVTFPTTGTLTTTQQVQAGGIVYAPDTGAANAYVVTLSPAPAAYTTGMVVNFIATNANTTTSTLNLNGLGAKTILKHHDQPLIINDIEAGAFMSVAYDGTNFQWLSQISGLEGTVLQVVQSTLTSTATIAGVTETDILTVAITPSTTTSRILLIAMLSAASDRAVGNSFAWLTRANTHIFQGDAAGSRTPVSLDFRSSDNFTIDTKSITYIDSPASAATLTYKIRGAGSSAGATMYINRTVDDSNAATTPRGVTSLIAIELRN